MQSRVVGRYEVMDTIAEGGMASVHIGRMIGSAGFARAVAVKKLHAQYARDPEFVAMLLDEARVVSRIRHPNVVSMLDVVVEGDEVLLVMEYLEGESLARLVKRSNGRVPTSVVLGIVTSMLHGLHAAHECMSDEGQLLGVVHRDVSPQNVLVCTDGLTRIVDFGIAKVAHRGGSGTRFDQLKGKLAYMAPEQLNRAEVDRRTDVYGASVVLWEALTGRRLFHARSEAEIVTRVITEPVMPPGTLVLGIPAVLDEIVMKGLARDPKDRYASARDMALAIENAGLSIAPPWQIGEWAHSMGQSSPHTSARFIAARALASDVSALGSGPLPPSSTSTPAAVLDTIPDGAETMRPPALDRESEARMVTTLSAAPQPSFLPPPTRWRERVGVALIALAVGALGGIALSHSRARDAGARSIATQPVAPIPPVRDPERDEPIEMIRASTTTSPEPAPARDVAPTPKPAPYKSKRNRTIQRPAQPAVPDFGY